jgi:hypothetical protein
MHHLKSNTSCIMGSKRQHLQQLFQQEQHLLHQQWTVPLTEGESALNCH